MPKVPHRNSATGARAPVGAPPLMQQRCAARSTNSLPTYWSARSWINSLNIPPQDKRSTMDYI